MKQQEELIELIKSLQAAEIRHLEINANRYGAGDLKYVLLFRLSGLRRWWEKRITPKPKAI